MRGHVPRRTLHLQRRTIPSTVRRNPCDCQNVPRQEMCKFLTCRFALYGDHATFRTGWTNTIYPSAKLCHGFCHCSVGIDRVCWTTSYNHQSNSVRSAVWRSQNYINIKPLLLLLCVFVLTYSISNLIPYDQLFVELKPLLCTHIFSINKCSSFWNFMFSFFRSRPIPLTCKRSLQLTCRRNSRPNI